MAINYTSPYERRARAQAIRAERESRRALYNNRLNQISAPQTAQNISDSAEAQTASQSEASPFVRTFATAGDVIGNVLTGAAKGLEGIFDLGASIVGAIGGIFDSNFQEDVKEVVAYNAADEWIGQPLQELTKDSYLTEGGFVENVASGIGQMLPAVAASVFTGGSSLASLGTMGVSAAGTGTESAFQDGADYYAGLGYGAASGVVEAATEKMFGGATKALFGKGALDAGKAVASTGIKRIAKNALEEGAEEIASELASPALKGIYKGGEAFEEYTQGDYWKGVLEAGGVGAATSLAYTGTVGNILAKKGKALSNRETDINDSLEAIGRQKRAAEQLFAENALTEINERKISANIRRNYENIQRALTKSKPEKRAEMIEKFSLGSAFDSDGLMKADFAATLGIEGNTNADTRYYSPSLRGQEEYINQRLEELGTRIYSGELTQEEQARYDKLKKVQNALSQKGLISSKLVLADTAAEFDSFLDDDIIVMGKDALESDVWQQKIIHETVHFTERTKEWEDFASFILNETDTEAAIQSVLQRDYGVTKKDADAVRAAMSDGKLDTSQLTDKQMLLVSEAVAYQSEALFGSEQMLEKLASTKTSLAHRILERIRHFIQVIRASSPEERKLINTLDNARRLLEKALNKAGSFFASEIYAAGNARVAENGDSQYNDNAENSQLSRKKASYISYDRIGAEDVSYVRERLNELYSGIDDAVADGIAIEKGTTVYIVDSGKENGKISFGFKKKITISDETERKEYLRRINNDAISRAFLSDGLSQRLGAELDKHRGSNRRYESREEFAADNRESQHNQNGISRTNGDRGRRVERENGSTSGQGVKFSLKKPLEYTKDLIAVHNLSESNLLNNISLGGFAMPSIAVLRADGSHSSYGDISVIFRPDAVNPQADSDNKIYSADAYTPRFPQVEYSLNRRALTALAEKLNTSTSSLEVNEFAGGDRNKIIENLSYNANAKELFAKENGLTVTPVLHEPEYSHSIYKIAAVRDYIASGISFHDLVYDEATRKEFIDIIRNAPTLKSMTAKWADRINGELDDAKNNQVIYEVLEETFENDRSIAMQKAEKIETSSSYAEGLDELVKEHADEYDAFIEKLVDSVLDKKWLRNNKPYYTNSGNPRSFKDLHEEYTAQNAVQLMKEQGSKVVEGGLFGYGVGEIRAALSKTYDSFDSLHKDEARIQDNQDEAIKAQYDKCSEALNEICGEIAGLSKVENKFMAHDIASAAVLDIISKTKSDTYAKAYVKKEYSIDITDEIVSKIRKLAKEIEKLPVKYFEAKPQRVVGFEEIAAVVVPSSVSESTISKLEELGIDVIVYNKDVPEDRKEAVNSIGNVRFSRKKSFSEQVDDVLKGADTNSTHLMLSETPEILQQAGLPRLPILMTARHLKTITQSSGKDKANYHGLGTEIVKKLPQLISEPVILADSLTRGDSIVVITEAVDSDNRPVIAAILLDGKGRLDEKHINANIMTSAYGRSNVQSFLNRLAEEDAVFYWDKKKSQEMSVSLGLQLPNAITNLASNTIIRKTRANVNTSANGEIKFSRKNRQSAQQLSPGQLRRVIANNTRRKVYSKADAETIVNNILTNYMDFGDSIGNISGKTKTEAINMLWESLNSLDEGRRAGFALDVADYIIYETTLENIWQDESLSEHTYIVEAIQPYLHTLDLSSLSAEIKNRYDGDNSIYLRWAKPKGERGISLDAAAMELAGNGLNIANYNPADILFELDDMYRKSKKALSANVKKLLTDSLDSKAREQLRQDIAKEVLRGFEYTGKASKLDGIISKYEQEIKKWQKRYYEEKAWNNAANKALYAIQKLRDFKTGAFLNASQYKSEIFKGSISKLTKISSRGNLNTSGTRRIFAGLREWYNKDNPTLEDVYSEETAAMLDRIAANEKPLTNEELDIINELEKMSGLTGYAKLRDWYTKAELKEKYNPETKKLLRELANEKSFSAAELRDIANTVDYFRHFAETFNKVLRNGKWVEARPIAEEYVELLQENQKIKIGWMNKVSGSSYARTFYDPAAVARRADLYENGFYTQSLITFREGAANAAIDEMEILEPLEEFRTRNKKYFKALDKRKVKYNGQEIPAAHALALYLTLGREQAQRGLAESGFKYEQDKTTVRINGFAPGGRLTGEALSQKAAEMQRGLYEQLNETDRELLSILREIFNKKCRDLKMSTDILLNGYSNVLNGEYMPIRRGNIAHGLEMDSWETEVNSVSNASFNKDTVQGAKGELLIESVMDVVYRHVKGITLYANLAPAVETYNRLLNMDISGNPNKPVSIATESQNVWREGRKYFEKLLDDIKGIPSSKGPGGRLFGQLRSGYALSVLGGNPKVWLTQFTSFAAATSILDTDSIIRGLKVDSADVDKYCPLAKLRNNDNTAAAAQGVLEQVGKIGNVLTKPIGKVDRFVIKRLFGACQVQVQKDSGFKIGTEQNKIKAGELLKKVIFETQQNALATERSAAMRSGSELMKTFTMFSSDAMKTIGRAIDGIGELTVLKQRRKLATDPKEIEYLDKRIKQARKKARKGITALVTSSIFMALITQLFRFLYNKDDEEDNVIENMTVDAVGNLLGGLPIIKDVYARLTEGYELDSYAYSTINNLMDSAAGIFNMTEDIISGKVDAKETARNVRNVLYSAGQLFGIPVRNMYNVGYGLTKRFSPSTAYNIDNMFYDQSYASDLAKAIEAEDDNMIATIAGIMLNENVGEVTSSAVRQELNRLIKAGYDVLPRSIGDSVVYDGEILELNNAQQRQFKQTYSEANEAAAKLVGLSQYKEASEEVKAKAVNFIYDVYYNRALEKLLGIELDNKAVLFSKSLDVPKLAIILMTAQSLTADKDKNGKSISGTKKAKVQTYINSLNLSAAQKYMIMGYLGYSNKNGSSQVKAYIQGLQLSKMQKEQLYAYSGYAA